jgi:hypothetical protein
MAKYVPAVGGVELEKGEKLYATNVISHEYSLTGSEETN